MPAIKVLNNLWLTDLWVQWVCSSVTDYFCNVVSCRVTSCFVESCFVLSSLQCSIQRDLGKRAETPRQRSTELSPIILSNVHR